MVELHMSTLDSYSSLYWACHRGDKRLVLELINPNTVKYVHPRLGDTPLHQACKQGWLDIVKIFIEKYDCDPNVASELHHETPLDYVKRHNQIDMVRYLVNTSHRSKGGKQVRHVNPQSMDRSLYWACALGHKQLAFKFANSDNVNYVDPHRGDTPLHQACKQGWLDVVRLLIEEYGCDPNIKSKYQHQDPLHYWMRTALEMTTDPEVINYLCKCDTVDVLSTTIARWINSKLIE